MIADQLKQRALPDILRFADGSPVTKETWKKRREEILPLLQHHMYGVPPRSDIQVESEIKLENKEAFAGKAVMQTIFLTVKIFYTSFTFPFRLILPKKVKKAPVFVHLSFSDASASEELPAEEILDNGYGIATVWYQAIAPDRDDNFANGLARHASRNPFDSWGKVSMWAWAASRIMDYLQTLDTVDQSRIAVIGHSRLGKTALWCGACDERFSLTVSNDSGAGGIALFRGKNGETIANLTAPTPGYWFCGNFKEFANREEELPFDQHFVAALVAPRCLYICSAKEDDWADPTSEFLTCAAVSPVYEMLGSKGLVADSMPQADVPLQEGRVGYHVRTGTHYLSRYDWQQVMAFRAKHGC